jgi:hypothetical protein
MPSATIFRLGWTTPQTDAFGAHPQLGPILDLNDGTAFALASPGGVELPPPPRTILTAGNVRAQGERATRAVYRHNRRVVVRLLAGPMSTYADLATNIRALVSWLAAPPAIPFAVQYQPAGASAPVYLDVVGAAHDIPADEDDWLRLQLEPVTLVLLARPGLRGDRVMLSNLAINPGFEAPSGPAVPVFADPFTGTSAYAVVSGAAPTLNPANTYSDIVLADAPSRYFRLDESSGTTAFDIAGGAHAGTYSGGFTLGAAGALNGDSDTACTFNGSTAKVSVPTTLMPTGNQPFAMECWFKFAANPAGAQMMLGYGDPAHANHQFLEFQLQATGAVAFNCGATFVASAPLTTGVYHHLLGTWDGTTMRFYVDGASVGTPATPGAQSFPAAPACLIGCSLSAANFFSGQVDEVAFYAAALAAARASAHFAAGSAGPSGTVANAMSLPAGAQVSFGSPNWGAVNTWQTRFRYTPGLTATWYLHYTDASNNLAVLVAAGTNAYTLVHTVAGVATTLAATTASLTPGAWYWLSCTQFPTVPGDPPYLQAVLAYDAAGSLGTALATLAAAASATAALAGQPRIAASGAALPIGGLASGAGHQLALFGPGGWTFTSFSDATAPASGAWDTTPATTYPGGPVASLAAARIDAPPAGTFHAAWRLYPGGTPIPLAAVAIPTTPATLNVAAYAQSSGLSAAATLALVVREYDAAGTFLRSGTAATRTGNQPAWVQVAGGYTTGASCAYVDLACEAKDLSAPGASANATVWLDNAQIWNQTATGMTSMPYCELRFPQSPAQLLVSGLLGDLPAPAFLAFGAYLAAWPKGASLAFAIGRRGSLSATARLAGPSNGFYGTTFTPTSIAALDPAGYGGYYVQTTVAPGWNPRAFSLAPADAPGAYHLIGRFLTQQAAANLANVQVRALVEQRLQPWYGAADQSDQLGVYYGPFTAPIAASGAWTIADAGPVTLPPFAQGALADPTQTYITPHMQWSDSTPGGSVCQMSWQALLPVDGALLAGLANNPSNAPAAVSARWLWAYADGLASATGQPAAWTYSLETAPIPAPAHAGGGPGTQTTGSVNLNPGADPTLTLDPNLRLAGGPGANQLLAYLADNSAAVLPVFAEIAYSPLYLYPR